MTKQKRRGMKPQRQLKRMNLLKNERKKTKFKHQSLTDGSVPVMNPQVVLVQHIGGSWMLPTWWTSSGTPRTAACWPTPWPCLTMLPLTWWSLPSLRLSETDGREESKSFPVQALEAVSLYCRGEQGPCPQGGACQHARHGMWVCQGPVPPVVSIPK